MSGDLVGAIVSGVFAFAGVLVASALVPWFRNRSERRESAQYLAIRVVSVLDRYGEDCATAASDWGEENEQGVTEPRISAPPTPNYPTDIDWRSIKHTLMYDLMMLLTLAERAASIVGNAWDSSDAPDYTEFFEVRCYQYGTLALRAFHLSTTLRKTYGIPDLDFGEWNPAERVKKELEDLRTRQGARFNAPPLM